MTIYRLAAYKPCHPCFYSHERIEEKMFIHCNVIALSCLKCFGHESGAVLAYLHIELTLKIVCQIRREHLTKKHFFDKNIFLTCFL